jgi:aryl-alcohol dehydrogenase-like predicted oxidoreductase
MVREPVKPSEDEPRPEPAAPRLSRRAVVAGAVGGAVAVGVAGVGLVARGGAAPPAPMRRRTLGRTGLEVSEVGFGGYPISDPDVLLYALDRGIDYVDTSHCYRRGDSESTIGRALASRPGSRDRIVLATKWCPHHVGREATKAVFLEMLDESLKRLQTDRVDVVFNHEVGRHSDRQGAERLKNPEMLEAFAEAKKAGKARFLGVSGHDGDLGEVVGYAIDSQAFDVLLCRYSFLDYPVQHEWIERAHAAGVGFVAMKTLAGAKGADLDRFKDRHTSFKQAALKWVLSNGKLSNLIISISSTKQVDEYVAASGAPLTRADTAVLDEYALLFSREVCRFCNACEPACPDDVRIADVLRYSMYFHEYGERERAVEAYAGLLETERAAHCAACSGFCAASCSYDLPVKRLLLRADEAFRPRRA